MIVRQGKVKRMLEWLSHVCMFSREHLPPERQQPQHLIREIGLELVTSEALATQGMESKLRCLLSEHAATAWNLGNGQSIEVNMPNLTAKPQVLFIHHQLIIPKVAPKDPKPLPVTVHGHPGRFAHIILREGDLCALVCTVEAGAWRDRSSGKCSGTGA
ncbi:BQ5605_C007g04871 [Microbotryum silenes-dioicae]|uniref:BQ5605_C007g04871 protein n=1 Tax=Microbotryum silenes-dioicae TaxID=796604 RepID=A0A2X0N2A8_9BASI|nr:BQ5605_C007g04871 [Microbotryum silenes-dioicae]